MATFTINSRKHGPQTFSVPSDFYDMASYVHVRQADFSTGTQGNPQQICEGGALLGETITCRPSNLERVARRWWSQFLRMERA